MALRRKLNKNFYKRMRKSEIFAGILADVYCFLSGGSEAKVKQKFLQTYEKIGNFRRNTCRRLLGGGNRQ
nr:MAG TPA: hypothetical protein [Caudoviricetes sp.]